MSCSRGYCVEYNKSPVHYTRSCHRRASRYIYFVFQELSGFYVNLVPCTCLAGSKLFDMYIVLVAYTHVTENVICYN